MIENYSALDVDNKPNVSGTRSDNKPNGSVFMFNSQT
jgi:hypothetical protein